MVQKRFPENSEMLYRYAADRTEAAMFHSVRIYLGEEAERTLKILLAKLEEIKKDTRLRDQSAMRGFSVKTGGGFAAIDIHGGATYANIFWHASTGWFVADW